MIISSILPPQQKLFIELFIIHGPLAHELCSALQHLMSFSMGQRPISSKQIFDKLSELSLFENTAKRYSFLRDGPWAQRVLRTPLAHDPSLD